MDSNGTSADPQVKRWAAACNAEASPVGTPAFQEHESAFAGVFAPTVINSQAGPAAASQAHEQPWPDNVDAWVNRTVAIRQRNSESVNITVSGCSSLGVCDLVGNVWQYTSKFEDAHTRAAVVRGGSRYHLSGWYFPPTYRLDLQNKMLLMDNEYERNAMTGFRCAKDDPPGYDVHPMSKSHVVVYEEEEVVVYV